jgi:hypothetical protein
LGGNYLCKSEDKKGKAAQEPTMQSNFESAVGRGVYASGSWRKTVSYSAPLLYPGQRHLIKFVLLVEVPGDLSDQGVGVAHKARAVYQEPPKTGKKKKAMMFHVDEGKDSWLIIPKSDYIDALAADVGDVWQPGAGKKLLAWARKVHSTLGIKDRIYDLPSGLNNAILTGNYKVPQSLQRRRDRHAMETVAEHGHTGGGKGQHDHGWRGVHEQWCSYPGRFRWYMGYNAHKRTTHKKRKDYCDCDVDTKSLLQCFMQAK